MSNKRFGALSSSTDPEKLGLTFQAGVLLLGGIITFFAGRLGYNFMPADIQAIANQGATVVTPIVTWLGATGTIIGLLRKAGIWLATRKQQG